MLEGAYPHSSEGPSPETCRRRSGEWRPAAAARNRSAPGGSGPRPPGTTTWLRGARLTDPEEMPEKEARPPAQNRHGGAPRGERVPLDARRASPGVDGRASRARQQKTCAFRRSARPSWGWMEREKQNPGAATRRGNEGGCGVERCEK